jgi:hypothetical protein
VCIGEIRGFLRKKTRGAKISKRVNGSLFFATLFLASKKTEKKQNCHSDFEAATIKPGVTKKIDREVHIADAVFAISMPIFICGCFLEIGDDKYACVVLGCSVQNRS